MPLSVCLRWLPKAGHRDHEYEDACWPETSSGRQGPVLRCAVADGATESAFAGAWARQLARAWGEERLAPGDLAAGLVGEQAAWRAAVDAQPLPWYAEEKARSGAFAALLGVTVDTRDPEQAGWQAFAVGDCALFHVRRRALVRSFPAEDAAFFTGSPVLISSLPFRNGAVAENLHLAAGALHAGDRLYLVTDALGQYLLQAVEAGAVPWGALDRALAGRRRNFAAWIDALRAESALRNDDVTVLRVTWASAGAAG